MLTIGIDPGIRGALAVLDDNGRMRVHDMPIRPRQHAAKVKNEIDPLALRRVLREFAPADESCLVLMEQLNAFIGGEGRRQGAVATMASLEATKAVICTVCELSGLGVEFVSPQRWQGLFGIKRRESEDTKKQSLRIAREIYGRDFCPLEKHDGRADAMLIARYGQQMFA